MHVLHLHFPLHFGGVPASSVEYKNSLGTVKPKKVRRGPGGRVTSVRCRAKGHVVPQHVVGLEIYEVRKVAQRPVRREDLILVKTVLSRELCRLSAQAKE